MNRVTATYLFAIIFLLTSLQVGAQVAKSLPRKAGASIPELRVDDKAGKWLSFDKLKENMGTLHDSDTVRVVTFTLRNVSDSAVTITNVTTHCGCTAAEFDKSPVAPGASSRIVVRYNPKGREGTIDTGAFVYTDRTGRRPVAKLTLLGNVVDDDEWSHLPYAMGDLKLKRKQVVFKNGRISARIPCANVGTTPMQLSSALLPAYATFTTEPRVLKPEDEGDIVISINPDSVPRISSDTVRFSIIIEGVAGSISSRTIKAIIE